MQQWGRLVRAMALTGGVALLVGLTSCTRPVDRTPEPPVTPRPTVSSTPFVSDRPSLAPTEADMQAAPFADLLERLAAQAVQEDVVLALPAGQYFTTRTVHLPAGLSLQLSQDAHISGNLPGTSLVRLDRGSTLSGGTFENTSTTSAFDVDFAENASDVWIRGATFRGRYVNAVYANVGGLRDIHIESNTFDGLTYGVLFNPGTLNGRGIRVADNTFTNVCGDPVEMNAATGATDGRLRDVTITGNHLSAFCGTGSDAGFGIGLAGVAGFTIQDNTIDGARNEAVHLEDGTANGTVRNNRISGGGVGNRPAVAIYRNTHEITLEGNRIDTWDGQGIAVLWDSIGSANDVVVRANRITDVTGDGIVVAGDVGTGPFTVAENTLTHIDGHGIAVAGPHARSMIEDNSLADVAKQGVFLSLRGDGVTVMKGNSVVP